MPPTPTSSGHFRVAVETAQPVTINRMYTWIVSVEDSGGRAALEAEIGVDGGVPGLQRHLPTAPRMTSALGGGKYRIDGVKFDMAGLWRLRLDVRAGGVADAVMFDVVVRP